MLALCAGCAGWSKANTTMELGFATEQAVDYEQTSFAVDHCAEWNPAIGLCGQNASPAAYFITTTLLHAAISAVLPRYWRETWQGATIAWQGANLYRNVGVVNEWQGVPAGTAARPGL